MGLKPFGQLIIKKCVALSDRIHLYFCAFKLGFIPRGSNHDISKYLDMGLGDIYEVRITRITPDVPPEHQMEVVLYVKSQK